MSYDAVLERALAIYNPRLDRHSEEAARLVHCERQGRYAYSQLAKAIPQPVPASERHDGT